MTPKSSFLMPVLSPLLVTFPTENVIQSTLKCGNTHMASGHLSIQQLSLHALFLAVKETATSQSLTRDKMAHCRQHLAFITHNKMNKHHHSIFGHKATPLSTQRCSADQPYPAQPWDLPLVTTEPAPSHFQPQLHSAVLRHASPTKSPLSTINWSTLLA